MALDACDSDRGGSAPGGTRLFVLFIIARASIQRPWQAPPGQFSTRVTVQQRIETMQFKTAIRGTMEWEQALALATNLSVVTYSDRSMVTEPSIYDQLRR